MYIIYIDDFTDWMLLIYCSFNGSNHHIASGKNSTKSKAWPTLAVDQGLYPRQVGPGCSETPEIQSWTLVKGHTVDGSEIPRSPVEVGSLSIPLFTRFYLSQVVHDF